MRVMSSIIDPPAPSAGARINRLTPRAWRRAAAACLFAATVASAATAPAADGTTALAAAACTALQDTTIPASAIGLPTGGATIQHAVQVAASMPGNVNGEFCKVTGVVANATASTAVFEFEMNLPSVWNGKVLQMGGGGYDGSLVTGLTPFTLEPANLPTPLKQGFVTVGSNGGHRGGPGFDGQFGLDDEALLNYGRASVKKTHDVAMAIVRKAYGRGPARVYFIGGSQGGHEALDAAARYPDDYDGVVANYPAYNVTLLHLGSFNAGKALYVDGGAGWMDAAHVKRLTDAVYAACDGLDGAHDGIISNVAGCDAAFDPRTLRCANGATGDACLSDEQLSAVAAISSPYSPGVTVAGMETFPKWPLLEGATFSGPSTFGTVDHPSNPISGKEPLLYVAGDQTIKYIITRDARFDPMQFDPKAWAADIARAASMMDVTNVSLAPFKAKGGKIVLTHGTADDLITPYNTVAYYERQVKQFGAAGARSFIRFFTIAGMGHGFGVFNGKFDGLGALVRWVEQGQAPAGLVAIDGNPGANRARPMCEWPAWPKFTGTPGTENQAASFTCTR